MRVGLYARVSTLDQQTLPLQIKAMREYVRKRGWTLALEVKDVGSGATERPQREALMRAARRREVDLILVWRLDRWGRSLADLVVTIKELGELGVGFVSLTEALDLTTPTGRTMAGMLAVSSPSSSGRSSESASEPASHRPVKRGGRTGGRSLPA